MEDPSGEVTSVGFAASAVLFGLVLAGACATLGLYRAERRIWWVLIAAVLLAPAAFMDGLYAFALNQAEQKAAIVTEKFIPSLLESIELPPPPTTTPSSTP